MLSINQYTIQKLCWERLYQPSEVASLPWERLYQPSEVVSLPWERLYQPSEVASLPWERLYQPSEVASLPWERCYQPSVRFTLPWERCYQPTVDPTLPWERCYQSTVDPTLPWERCYQPTVDPTLPWERCYHTTVDAVDISFAIAPSLCFGNIFAAMFTRKSMEALGRMSANEAVAAEKRPIVLILDDVRSMHNVGSAFRTADGFGIQALYLCGYTPAPPHRDIRKTALGAEDTVSWKAFATTTEAILHARAAGYRIVAVEQAEGSTSLNNYNWDGLQPLALVLGNEVNGVSDEALALADDCIEIPQAGAKHSLNVSVTTGVVLWELVRKML